ncbi:hypothetical protein SAMN05216562_1668 [Microbulbifer marinus]|uniref:Uncharacterized protein n=1 Tax=Microbulbifer marinus TaxID=658218 RepID=A0A1H3YD67_9GAMM|nr:hypothetical protein SAMN05216562_1668 [Microbulbifer marinus]
MPEGKPIPKARRAVSLFAAREVKRPDAPTLRRYAKWGDALLPGIDDVCVTSPQNNNQAAANVCAGIPAGAPAIPARA